MKTQSKQILEQMVREISSDSWGLTKRIIRGSLYLATAPFLGLLGDTTLERVYAKNKNAVFGSRILSYIPGIVGYPLLASTLTNDSNYLTMCGCYGLFEATARLTNFSENDFFKGKSLIGIIPDMALNYIFRKYDSAKEKIKEDGELK